MATEQFKAEVDAIGVVLAQLEPLSDGARRRVLDYVLQALQMSPGDTGRGHDHGNDNASTGGVATLLDRNQEGDGDGERRPDIRSLREQKQPRSAVEMAVVASYYLTELAPDDERKEAIETADLTKLFKQAAYPLPAKMPNILGSAASAGYLDLIDRGHYRLNPVGHNLVVHNLPTGDGSSQPRKRAGKKAPTKKSVAKAPVKKSVAKKAPAKKSVAKKVPAKKSVA